MSNAKRLVKNTLSLFFARGLQPLLSFALVLVIGRVLGPETFGKYSVIFELYFIFQITSAFGLRLLTTREVAADKSLLPSYLSNTAMLSVLGAVLNMFLMVGFAIVMNYDPEIIFCVAIISVSLIAASLTEVFSGILAGVENITSISYGWIGFLILKTVFSVSAVYMGMGLIELIVIHSVLKFLQPAYYLWEIRRGKPELQFKIDWRFSGHLIAAAWRLALLIIVTTIFWRLDTIMLSKMATNVKVANYQAAFKMFWFAMLMLRSFFVAIFPMMSSMFVERRADFERACRKSIRYLVLLALPIGIIVSTYAPQFMPWLWGTKYPEASGVLQILIWALLPFSISEILGQALLASKNEMTNLVLNSIVLVIKFGLNYWLIQQYGIAGVGYATVIMLSILVIMQLPFVIPNLMKVEWKKVISAMGRTISIAGLLLGLAIMCKNIHFIPGMVLLAIVYLVMLFLFRVIHINDRARLTGWMKKRA